jgi:hypothetical protein
MDTLSNLSSHETDLLSTNPRPLGETLVPTRMS